MLITEFGDLIAARMRAEHEGLAARWFDRLLDLLPVDAQKVFPSDSLLDHIPSLIAEISDCLHSTHDGAIAANAAVLDKASELGALRHGQHASLHQVLREYQILSGVLVQFVLEELERQPAAPVAVESAHVISRIHRAVDVLTQRTVETFVTLYTRTIADQANRLEQFTRMATHEWRQPLGALQFGISALQQNSLDEPAKRIVSVLGRNVAHLVELTRKLEAVARIHATTDTVVTQTVRLETVAREAARQLREMAEMRAVDIRIGDDMPQLTVDVGRLELTLLNLLSNAIKYSDVAKPERVVEVTGTSDGVRCEIRVLDNGIGIPEDAVGAIFERFTRAHADLDPAFEVPGVGLGLSIVDDCVRAMGGQVRCESRKGEGTSFILTLPITPLPAS